MPAPTIGRRVYFWPGPHCNLNVLDWSQPCDAGVVFVHPDGKVNLAVTDHSGRTLAVPHVPFGDFDRAQTEEERNAIHDATGYADWMPYQKGASHTAPPSGAAGEQAG